MSKCRNFAKRALSIALCVLMLCPMLMLGGCFSPDDWNGTWNREGDATYSRAIMTIANCDRKGFYFYFDLYNGNLAGQIPACYAEFVDQDKTVAVYTIPDTDVMITFALEEEGLNVIYSSATMLEQDIWGFRQSAYITGLYSHGEVEYLNPSLVDMGVLDEETDEVVRSMISDTLYLRLLDCYQTFSTERVNTIAADVYYGRVTGDDYAAVICAFDDGTVSMIISGEKMLYYTNNATYTAELATEENTYPAPIKQWIIDYEALYYQQLNEEMNS